MARGRSGYWSGLERPSAHCRQCGQPRTREGKDGKRICKTCRTLAAEGKSRGHVEFIGPFEYFYAVNGDLFRAPKDSPLDVHGYRMGGRFESTPVVASKCLALAREAFSKDYT
jgi:hypothetical protein